MLNAPLDHSALCSRIPHAGSMCLLAEVVAWDREGITCLATSHRDPENPLRRDDQLAAVCGAEYAAQAMAVHGALLSGGAAGAGFLAALRGVELHQPRLDNQPSPLTIHASRLGGDGMGFIYSFTLHAGPELLVEGRATVLSQREESE